MTSAVTLKPEDVHPTHDVREEGYLYSDPVCQHCRRSVCHTADHQALRDPCAGTHAGEEE